MSQRPHTIDQATRLRELTSRGVRHGRIIAVTSGKGGVGKSSIAVNLAIAMADRGLRVTLVDVDLGLANADVLLNVQPRHTLSHVVAGIKTLDDVAVDAPGGIRFIPGGSGLQELANVSDFERQSLISQLQRLRTSTDIVVLDCGAGISRNVTSFALAADRVVIVTTPQPTAVTDAYAAVKILYRSECHAPMGLIVNMAESRAQAGATYCRLRDVAQKFLNYSVADDGFLLHDTVVEQAVLARCPFVLRYPRSVAGTCIASIAAKFLNPLGNSAGRSGLLRRVAGLFV